MVYAFLAPHNALAWCWAHDGGSEQVAYQLPTLNIPEKSQTTFPHLVSILLRGFDDLNPKLGERSSSILGRGSRFLTWNSSFPEGRFGPQQG